MDLIYGEFVNNKIEDINVLQDYSYDSVIGVGDKNVNDFECKVQSYNNKCKTDDVLYIEFTEYGGIIDRVEHDSKTGVITYKGRTWHGVLNSHVIQGYKTYGGEINEIIEQMIIDAGMDFLFVVDLIPVEDRHIEVSSFFVSYEKLYDAIIRLLRLKEVQGKLICYFYSGKVHLGATIGVDYSADEEFDTSKTPYKTGRTANTVNHLICLGKGDGENRPVIHLFTNDVSQDLNNALHIQPYTLIDEPLEDSEYILDERNKIMTGKDEIAEIYDNPNSEIITNYKPLDEEPGDWATDYFKKYYENGEPDEYGKVKKRLIKEKRRTEFHLLNEIPGDWAKHFAEYYKWDDEKAKGDMYIFKGDIIVKAREDDVKEGIAEVMEQGGLVSVREKAENELTEGNGITYHEITEKPEDWLTKYSTYYMDSGSSGKTSVSGRSYDKYGADDEYDGLTHLEHNGQRLTTAPPDWGWAFSTYFTRNKNVLNQWVYTSIQGIPVFHFEKVTRSSTPANWANEWGSYYRKVSSKVAKKYNGVTITQGSFIKASDALKAGKIHKQSEKKPYPKYEKDKYYVKVDDKPKPPNFKYFEPNTSKKKKLGDGVYERFPQNVAPEWEYPTKHYYEKKVDRTPTFVTSVYYKKYDDQRQVPEFKVGRYFYAVLDRYRKLVEKGIEQLKKLNDKDTLQMNLELDSNYDVLDVLGLWDDVTGVPINKPILRKIIKIKKDILTVDYEMD